MKFNALTTTKNRQAERAGRGIAAGKGKTAGRGTKGQGSRKSGGVRPGFEGGQMPLYMRIPKLRGFKSHRPKTHTVYTHQLQAIKSTVVDTNTLTAAGLIENPYVRVKLIAKGDLSKKLTVRLPAASLSSQAILKKAGGSFEKVEQLKRPKKITK